MSLERDWMERGKRAADPRERVKCFEQVVKINPNNLEATHLLGYHFLHMGQPKKAVKWFEKTIALDREFWAAWNNMAIAYIEMDKLDKALKAVNEALNINEDNPAALDTRSEIYFKMGDFKHATRDAKDSIELMLKGETGEVVHGEPWARVGTMYYQKKKLKKAWKYFKQALKHQLDPRDVKWINDTMVDIKKDLKKYIEKKIAKLEKFLAEVEKS
ncbi:MAG: tetratricopeptide repeat protein [Promethearchaeota archaeon]